MTTATEIIGTSRNASEAMDQAECITDDINQNWEDETTTYTFRDGSKLVVSGPCVNAE